MNGMSGWKSLIINMKWDFIELKSRSLTSSNLGKRKTKLARISKRRTKRLVNKHIKEELNYYEESRNS